MDARSVKAKLRKDIQVSADRNDVFGGGLVCEQLFDATKARILKIVDAFTRFPPAVERRFD